jgi:hypothetical protein
VLQELDDRVLPPSQGGRGDAAVETTTPATRSQTSGHLVNDWTGFEDVLAWLEIGDGAQARRAFLRALNTQ